MQNTPGDARLDDGGGVAPGRRALLAVPMRLRDRRLDGVVRGPVGAVDALEAALPSRETGFVQQKEEAERTDRLVTLGAHDHLAVVLSLGRLVDRRLVLSPRVQPSEARQRRDLPADLVQL